ncbi:hypothetical protein F2Q68_00005114 [Brassica cretica]|uniref:Aspartic peptidase DDI1-type domain-containing protein n=1 Tax=Brassica cretica TaxID=69181 RepID=A0A8S9JEL4_BRACR|nr:hypothetical protein F2Q68_00005114 [Brassica cretica]
MAKQFIIAVRSLPKPIDILSSTSIENTYGVNHILQCHEAHDSRGVRSKTPTSASPVYVKIDRHYDPVIDRHQEPVIDRHQETVIDQQPPAPIDRRAPFSYRVQMPKIDVSRLDALWPKPKPSENPPEAVRTPSEDETDRMEVDKVPTGRTLRKRKKKVEKHLNRGVNEKEKESFRKKVFRTPLDKPFDEAYFTHRLWMFFRETRETEEDIRRMFCEAREQMRKWVTLKKKNDLGQFAIPCTVKGIEFRHVLCDTGALVSILPWIMADHLGLQVDPSKELFTFVDCSQRNLGGIVRDLEVQIVGTVCNLQTNQLFLMLIDPHVHYNPIPVKKPQTTSRRINDLGIIAACHCGAEYETEYSASIETHTAISIDSAQQKSTDGAAEESVDTSTDIAYYPSIDNNVDATRDGDYSIGSWADDRHHESYAVETAYCDQGVDELHEGFTYEEILNMQRHDETDQKRAEAAWERTHFSHPIDRAIPPSIDINPSTWIDINPLTSIDINPLTSIDINHTTSIDSRPKPKTTISEKEKLDNRYLTPDEFGIFRDPEGYTKAIDGRTLHVSREDIANILQTTNGADNLFMQQRTIPEHQQKVTKEFYDTAGGIDKRFNQRRAFDLFGTTKFYWEEKDEYGIYIDDQGYARDVDGHTIRVHNKDIRRLLERASRDDPNYICLLEHASSFTQTKLVPEIYTKDEINEMFYGICGEQEKNKEDFQMKLDGVYYPLNDSMSWLTSCMEGMSRLHASIDNRLPASVDDNPPRSHAMKSQPDFHIREEIYQLIEAIQGELVEIQSYIARRPEASASIDRRNNKSTDTHIQTSVDDATNQGRLVQKVTSDMSNTHNREEEISANTDTTIMRHQFNLESIGDRLLKIEYATTIMKDKWRRGDDAMRNFTDSIKDTKVDQPVN